MHCGLPMRSTVARDRSRRPRQFDLPQILRRAHRRAERVALAVTPQQLQRLHARVGLDHARSRRRRAPASRATSAARQRSPLPDSSDALPSAFNSCIVAPRWTQIEQDQAVGADARGGDGTDAGRDRAASRASVRRRHEQEIVAVGVGLGDSQRRHQGICERVEDVGEPGARSRCSGRATSGRRAPPRRRASCRWCSARRRAPCPATPVPGGGVALARVDAAVDLADDFGRLGQRPREREAVGQHVVLPVAARRIAEDAQADVADDADRLDGLGHSSDAKKSVVSRPRPLSFDAFGSLVANRNAERRPRWRLRTPGAPSCRSTMSSTLEVVSPVAVTMSRQRRAVALGDRQAVVEPAVDLHLGDRADAEADADERQRAAGCPRAPTPDTRRRARSRSRPRPARGRRRSVSGSSVTSGRCWANADAAERSSEQACGERRTSRARHQNCRLLSIEDRDRAVVDQLDAASWPGIRRWRPARAPRAILSRGPRRARAPPRAARPRRTTAGVPCGRRRRA